MSTSERAHLEVVPRLSSDMKPFRLGGPYLHPIFYSDGKKAVRANEIGLRTAIFPRLAYVMDRGEKTCHLEYRPDSSIGPYEVNGIPYPLLTVLAKGKPARKALWEEGLREGIGVVSDVVIGFMKNGRSFAVTAHKLKSEKDRKELIRTLYAADLAEDVEVITMAAVYRFNQADQTEQGELYMVQLDHGHVKIDDMVTLINQLNRNNKTSGSMDTRFILDHLTRHEQELKVTVSKFDEQKVIDYNSLHFQYLMVPDAQGKFIKKRILMPNVESIRPEKQVSYKIPAENTYQAETFALGFVS